MVQNQQKLFSHKLSSLKETIDNATFQIKEVNAEWDTTAKMKREDFWIHQLHTSEPDDLNKKDEKRFRKDKD